MVLWFDNNVTVVVNIVMFYLVIMSDPTIEYLLEVIKIYWTGLNLIDLRAASILLAEKRF